MEPIDYRPTSDEKTQELEQHLQHLKKSIRFAAPSSKALTSRITRLGRARRESQTGSVSSGGDAHGAPVGQEHEEEVDAAWFHPVAKKDPIVELSVANLFTQQQRNDEKGGKPGVVDGAEWVRPTNFTNASTSPNLMERIPSNSTVETSVTNDSETVDGLSRTSTSTTASRATTGRMSPIRERPHTPSGGVGLGLVGAQFIARFSSLSPSTSPTPVIEEAGSSSSSNMKRLPSKPIQRQLPPLLRQALTRTSHKPSGMPSTPDQTPSPRVHHHRQFHPGKSMKPREIQRFLKKRLRKLRRGEFEEADVLAEELERRLVLAGQLKDETGLVAAGGKKVVQTLLETDILYEHQRGLVIFGERKFSSQALFQFDPAPWTNRHLKNSPFTPRDHPLPNPFWKWVDSDWLVDVGGDTDEDGWSYSYRFRSSTYHPSPSFLRSLVRRRRWIRRRSYTPKALSPQTTVHSPTQGLGTAVEMDWDEASERAWDEFLLGEGGASGTPDDGSRVWETRERRERGKLEVTGLKKAVALLPLSSERKDALVVNGSGEWLEWKTIVQEGEGVLESLGGVTTREEKVASEETVQVWKEAVVEYNFRRVCKLFKGSSIDREKLDLWKYWLGVKMEEDTGEGGISQTDRPSRDDLWDLVEGRLDGILRLFEFQSSRLTLLRLILSHCPTSIPKQTLDPDEVGSRLGRRMDFFVDVAELEKSFQSSLEEEGKYTRKDLLEENGRRKDLNGKGKGKERQED